MEIIKVYNTKLGLFSKGGMSYTNGWTKNGKAWTSIGAFKNHLNMSVPVDKFRVSIYRTAKTPHMDAQYFEEVLNQIKYQSASLDDCKVIHFTHNFNVDNLIKEIIEKKDTYYPQAGSTNTPAHITWSISPLRAIMMERILFVVKKNIESAKYHTKLFDEANKQQMINQAIRMASLDMENDLLALQEFYSMMLENNRKV